MNLLEWVITIPPALAWIYLAICHGRFWRILIFDNPKRDELSRWPEVRVVVPARNEAEVLPQTLPVLLQQDYPGTMRVVVVNDHSADDTGSVALKIIKELKLESSCQVLDAESVETGWTGKLWALEQGVRLGENGFNSNSQPDYFLFTDADVRHEVSNVRELVKKAESESLDLVSLMVKLRCDSFWERLLIPAFIFFFQKLYPFSRVNDPKSKTSGAAGGCILLRACALKRIDGLRSIQSELIDDCALAKKVKGSGGAIWLGLTDSARSLREYESLSSIWNMVARTAFTQLGFSSLALIGTILGMTWLYLWAPLLLAGGIFTGSWERIFLGILIWSIFCLLYWPTVRFYKLPSVYSFFLPLVAFLYTAMTLDSARRHWQGSGGRWKGRSYSRTSPKDFG